MALEEFVLGRGLSTGDVAQGPVGRDDVGGNVLFEREFETGLDELFVE